MNITELSYFASFILFVFLILAFDLLFVGRKTHIVSFKESTIWTLIWISFALLFYIFLKFYGERLHGIECNEELLQTAKRYANHLPLSANAESFQQNLTLYRNHISLSFITGYIIEYTLSIDNLFVILMILTSFSVRPQHYKPVLFYGILGAVILRCIFIFAGAALIHKFHWILTLFGIFLTYSGIKIFLDRNKEEKIEPQKHWMVKFLSKHIPVFKRYVGKNFFIKRNKKIFITPLFIVVMLIEFTDLVFALDSIPAIFAVTTDPYIVFFANIFAIIGLRSLFFMLANVADKFRYLKIGISLLLVFVGIKLIFENKLAAIGFKTEHSLYIILTIIILSILFSVIFHKKEDNTT
ncbi:MAG: TerC/Alx family metal homeostasis membrane protein [Deltaproteobacteria bacterium]|nr:TerC/Alx family metal homeostasis membrane protein [Deltaproteobacteria bacterium]